MKKHLGAPLILLTLVLAGCMRVVAVRDVGDPVTPPSTMTVTPATDAPTETPVASATPQATVTPVPTPTSTPPTTTTTTTTSTTESTTEATPPSTTEITTESTTPTTSVPTTTEPTTTTTTTTEPTTTTTTTEPTTTTTTTEPTTTTTTEPTTTTTTTTEPTTTAAPTEPPAPDAIDHSRYLPYPPAPDIGHLDPEKPMVAITYDDGPYFDYDTQIMDILDAHGAKATFYVLGEWVSYFPDVVKDMHARGHEIGNHSDYHRSFIRIPTEDVFKELNATDQKILDVTGHVPRTIRPPYGRYTHEGLRSMNRTTVLWTIDSEDWLNKDVDQTVARALDGVRDGSIILMHSLIKSSIEATRQIVTELEAQGFQMVTVSELIAAKGWSDAPGGLVNPG